MKLPETSEDPLIVPLPEPDFPVAALVVLPDAVPVPTVSNVSVATVPDPIPPLPLAIPSLPLDDTEDEGMLTGVKESSQELELIS